jgi:D-alanine-D-alanine ligase-like ATP-grasp enzyme
MSGPLVVVLEPWRLDPLAWIHRAEARAVARELGAPLVEHARGGVPGNALLRLSDSFMRSAVAELARPYHGPSRTVLERCYDKLETARIVSAGGIAIPETFLASSDFSLRAPFVLKPRRGSDSIGVRVARAVPPGKRNSDYLVQSRIVGREITIALFRDRVGQPLEIFLPRGKPYSFIRKYVIRPARAPVDDSALREAAAHAGSLLGVDWAARVDFIIDEATQRAHFLECDAAPLVGPGSAFAASFAAAGIDRQQQLDWLVS